MHEHTSSARADEDKPSLGEGVGGSEKGLGTCEDKPQGTLRARAHYVNIDILYGHALYLSAWSVRRRAGPAVRQLSTPRKASGGPAGCSPPRLSA